jgi:hypothetical protein
MTDVLVGRRGVLAALAAGVFTIRARALAASGVPVRIRVIRGSRQGPPQVDPRLGDVQGQLSRLAYQRWEQTGEHTFDMGIGKTVSVPVPGASPMELTLTASSKDTVTFQLKLPRGQSKLTISKDQRIVHQVTEEKDGAAHFATIRPWP